MSYECADFFMTRVSTGVAAAELSLENPEFLEAIAIASPTLYQAVKSGKCDEKTKASLLKYHLRLSSRATPFGAFSFVWMGEFEEKTKLRFDLSQVKKKVRIDGERAHTLAQEQEKQKLGELKVMINPCNVVKRGKVHLERRNAKVSIRMTPVVEEIYRLAKKPMLFAKLEKALIAAFHEEERVKRCLEQVFKEGYLISELSPCLTSPPSCDRVEDELQVDSYYAEKKAVLPGHIKDKLEEAASILVLLNQGKSHLDETHKQFLERYGTTRLVPLLTLQPSLHSTFVKSDPPYFGKEEILLDEWVKRQKPLKNSPLSLELFFEILADSEDAIDRGEYTLALNPAMATGQAGSAFGRFLYLWDDKSKLRSFLKKEEAQLPGVAFVEATFNPYNPRTTNVCYTETMRDFTLQLHYREGESLDLDDIYVGATSDYLYLYSKKLSKEIRVVLSTAVNSELAPSALKLALGISNHRFSSFSPFIFESFSDAPFLPRVRYKNIIFSPARWRFTNEADLLASDVPQIVYLMDGDNRLLLKWREPHEFKFILEHLKAKKEIILMECLKMPALAASQKGLHVTEFVAPLIKKEAHPISSPPPLRHISNRIQMPGCSEWLYAKISLPSDFEKEFITAYLTPFIHKHSIGKWFFVRYAEGTPQLRLRLYGKDLFPLLSSWCGRLMENELINGFSFECYEREVERYEAIELAEEVFCADSDFCLYQLTHSRLKPECQAALNILSILNAFFDDEQQVSAFLSPMQSHMNLLSGLRKELKELKHSPLCDRLAANLKAYARQVSDKLSIAESLIHMHCNRLLGIDHTAERRARSIAYYLNVKERGGKRSGAEAITMK